MMAGRPAGSGKHLRTSTFLDLLPEPSRRRLVDAGARQIYGPGVRLFTQGDGTAHVLVLLSGKVKVTLEDLYGHHVLIDVRSQGDLVGEMECLVDGARAATVTTIGPVQARVISRERFLALLQNDPIFSNILLRFTVRRLQAMNQRRVDLSRRVPDRLYRLLVELVDRYGEATGEGPAIKIGIELSQAELASSISASDASVEKVMGGLRRSGIATSNYRQIIVHRPDELRALADSCAPPTADRFRARTGLTTPAMG